MKLRNKKTGGLANILGEQDFIRVYTTDAGWTDYTSLAELNEEWEDFYAPAEPSIKDKKIRKFVSDWATLTQTTKILVVNRRTTRGEEITEFFSQERMISLEIIGRFDLLDMKEYTIIELCGEEK